MWESGGIEFSIRLIQLASAFMVSITVGIIGSAMLAYVAYSNGLPAERIFNATGPLLTLLTFLVTYRRHR